MKITEKFYGDLQKILIAETTSITYPSLNEITDFLKSVGVLKVRMTRSWPQKKKGYREVLIEGWIPFEDPKAKKSELEKQANDWLTEKLKKYRDSGYIDTPPGMGWSYVKGDSHFKLETTFKAEFA